MLRLPDLDLPFEVQIDASDRALGGVLVQEGHSVVFESRKLNNAEQRYSTHEKEMTIVVHCLQQWRHYLLRSIFIVVIDNVANTFFKTQKKLSPRQARWKEVIAYITALSEVISDFNENIKQGGKKVLAGGRSLCGKRRKMMDKTERKKATGLLQPLPIPERPWDNIFMDFITRFLKVHDFKSAFVVVDRFSKYAVFVPAPNACPTRKWLSRFWVELFKLLGSKLKFSTVNHPQTDGPDREDQRLAGGIPQALSTGMSPFELAIGVQPRMPLEDSLEKVARRMKKYADRDCRPLEFQVGDKATYMLKLPERLKLHPTFHASFLKPYHEDLDAKRVQRKRVPFLVMKQFDQEIEKILDHRIIRPWDIAERTGELISWFSGRDFRSKSYLGERCYLVAF
ncbi:Retrovirus-related Pol polyprotein from transposon 297 [Vitis vinifera]|uniref:Retrovirus-related Pol polyprotein from transposon 297 n=1 Tax=Vitis vinifera TaxID=29760 RepID=A0A438I5X0_VITVI|nr:Retrovirus-related Pol polyprotein from transposon 297 [Vitis vinifera]